MANRFDVTQYRGRELDANLKKELEEAVKQFLFDEGCYGSVAVANVMVELFWIALKGAQK